MTEKEIRKRLATAKPAEVPIVCLYLVAAVFEGPPLELPDPAECRRAERAAYWRRVHKRVREMEQRQ